MAWVKPSFRLWWPGFSISISNFCIFGTFWTEFFWIFNINLLNLTKFAKKEKPKISAEIITCRAAGGGGGPKFARIWRNRNYYAYQPMHILPLADWTKRVSRDALRARLWCKNVPHDGGVPTSIHHHIGLLLGARLPPLVLLRACPHLPPPGPWGHENSNAVPALLHPGSVCLWLHPVHPQVPTDTICGDTAGGVCTPATGASFRDHPCVRALPGVRLCWGWYVNVSVAVALLPHARCLCVLVRKVQAHLGGLLHRGISPCSTWPKAGYPLCSDGVVSAQMIIWSIQQFMASYLMVFTWHCFCKL